MNATEIATLSMSELRAFCTANSIEVTGDRRYRISYINAINAIAQAHPLRVVETFQSEQTVTDIESLPAMPDPFEVAIDLPLTEAAVMAERSTTSLDLYMESDGSPTPQPPTPQPTAPKPHRQASIVVLIPLILLSVAIISIRIGISTLIPIIGSLMRFTGEIWQSSITGNAIGTESVEIDSHEPHDTLFLHSKWALLE
jgi:hypothetical protein